ncbi:hypothetical protein Tco_1363009 [Tanacetum coccineum]
MPTEKSAYATISSEESHKVSSGSVFGSYLRNQASGFGSNVPNRGKFSKGIDRCFKIIGYLANFGKKKSGQVTKGKNVSNNAVRSSSYFGFTDEQMATLIYLIKDNKVGKSMHANMAGTYINNSHVRRVLEIVDLFHFPGITHDAVMLRVFPITFKGRALRWKKGSQQDFKEAHLTKEFLLKKEDKAVEQSEKVKARTTMGKESMKDPVPCDLSVVQTYAPPTLFLGHLKGQKKIPYKTHETLCAIRIPEEIHEMKSQGNEGNIKDS